MNWPLMRISVLALLLATLAASAAFAQTGTAALRAMWGTHVTAAEFLQKVNPGFLASLPARCREAAKTIDVQWGGENAVMTSTRILPNPAGLAPDSSNDAMSESSISYTIFVECSNRLSFSGTTASFGASNTVWEPLFLRMPFMSVHSQLLCDGCAIDARTSSKYNVWRVTASGSHYDCPPGYIQNIGYHSIEFPPGCTPQYGFQATESLIWEMPG